MKKVLLATLLLASFLFVSCGDDDEALPNVQVIEAPGFEQDGNSGGGSDDPTPPPGGG